VTSTFVLQKLAKNHLLRAVSIKMHDYLTKFPCGSHHSKNPLDCFLRPGMQIRKERGKEKTPLVVMTQTA
jgi:hypothetical protein